MEYTFTYDVEMDENVNQITSVSFKEELTKNQEQRLRESYDSGKYYSLDEDENIADIYDMVLDTAIQLEEQEEYGELIGTEVRLTNFRYPEELK